LSEAGVLSYIQWQTAPHTQTRKSKASVAETVRFSWNIVRTVGVF